MANNNQPPTQPAPVALQLYSIREQLERDFAGVMRHVAEIGYEGVETAGFPGSSVEEASRRFSELDLAVAGAHVRLPIGAQRQEILDTVLQLGCRRVISTLGREFFSTIERVKQTCDDFNEAAQNAAEEGLTFGIHNHWWEFEPVEGVLPFELMLERLDPSIFFEIDTYWVRAAGRDPIEVVRDLGARAPLIHLKDGPATKDAPMSPLGTGVMDLATIIKASSGMAEWLIVELDRVEGEMLPAVEQSYQWLAENGFARGGR